MLLAWKATGFIIVIMAWLAAQINFPTDFGPNLILWSALVAQFMPPIIAVIARQDWSSEQKGLTALVLCLIVSIPIAYFQGHLNLEDYVTSALIVFTLTTVMYKHFWQPSGIAPAISKATG